MIDAIVSSLLVQYLDQYIVNFDKKSIRLSLLSGDIRLRDLQLKAYALDNIDPNIPVVIEHGYLGTLDIKIPNLASLNKSAVVVDIANVFLVLKPKKSVVWDEEVEQKRLSDLKQQQLKQYELNRKIQKDQERKPRSAASSDSETEAENNIDGGGAKKRGGLVDRLLEMIINNIQIRIRNVHARYEDEILCPGSPIVLGATLEGIDVQSTDEDWNATFVKKIKDLTYKLVELSSFALYMNLDEDPNKDFISRMQGLPLSQVHDLLQESIHKGKHQYILEPVQGTMKLTMQKLSRNLDLSKPQFNTDCLFKHLAFRFTNKQYRHFVHLIEYLTNYSQHEPMRKYRPAKRPTENPRGWWKYAMHAVVEKNRRSRISWKTLQKRKQDKIEYIKLYKKFLRVPWESPLTDEDTNRFNALEVYYSVDDLIFFRKLANAEISEESKRHTDMRKTLKKRTGWFGWKLDAKAKEELKIMKAAGIERLTDEQKLELYKAIGFSGTEESSLIASLAIEKEFIKIKMHFHLVVGSVTILDSHLGEDQENTHFEIAQIRFDHLTSDVQIMDKSFQCLFTVGNFSVLDKRDTPFQEIISRRKGHPSKSLVSIFFEKNPPGSKSDYYLAVNTDRIDILFNIKLIQHITGFFLFDDVNFTNLEAVAKRNMDKVKLLAKEELKKALENKKTFDIQLNFLSPNIFVPVDSEREDTRFLLFDLGTLSLKSDIDAQRSERLHMLQDIRHEDYFDKFHFSLTDIQVIIPQCTVREYLDIPERYSHTGDNVLEKTSFRLEINKSVVPDISELDRLSMSSSIASMKFNISPHKLEVFTTVVNEIIAFVDNPTGDSGYDIKYSGYINARGPFSSEWHRCWIEVRMTRFMFIYDDHLRTRTLAMIKLSSNVKFQLVPNNERIFLMTLPQIDGSSTKFYFGVQSAQERTQWVNSLSSILYSFDTNFFVGNVAKMIVRDIKKEWKEQEQGKGVLRASSLEQVLLSSNIVLEKLTIALQQPHHDSTMLDQHNSCSQQYDLAHFIFDTLSTGFRQRISDTVLDIQLQSFAVRDMSISSSNAADGTVLSSDNQQMGSIKLTRAVWPSPLFSEESVTVIEAHIHSIKIMSEPVFMSRLIDFGFDLRILFDDIETKRNIYSATSSEGLQPAVHVVDQKEGDSHTSGTMSDKPKFLIKFIFQLGNINITLKDHGSQFASIVTTGSVFNMLVNRDLLHLYGDLGTLACWDHSTEDSLYREILGLKDKGHSSLLSFEFRQNLKPSFQTVEYNKWFKINVSSIKYVHIQRFVTMLQGFIHEPLNVLFLRERNRLADQSQATYSRGATTQHDDTINYSVNTRLICWNVSILSPTIVFPCSFQRHDHYIADLGRVTINTRIASHRRHVVNQSDQALIDDSKRWTVHTEVCDIFWQSMYLSSVDVSNQNQQQQVVDNVDIRFMVTNALIDPDRTIPEHAVTIDVSDIQVSLSKTQYQLIFDFVNENILDGLTDIKEHSEFYKALVEFSHERIEVLQRQNRHHRMPVTTSDKMDSLHKAELDLTDQLNRELEEQRVCDLFTRVKVMISVPSMHLSLQREETITGKDIKITQPIATLDMKQLQVLNQIMNNGEIKVNADLHSIVGMDARPETQNMFKRVFDARHSRCVTNGNTLNKHCIQVEFHKNPEGIAHLAIVTADPVVVFVPDIIMEVVDFFANINYGNIRATSPISSETINSVSSTFTESSADIEESLSISSNLSTSIQIDTAWDEFSDAVSASSDGSSAPSGVGEEVIAFNDVTYQNTENNSGDGGAYVEENFDLISFSVEVQFGNPILVIPEDSQHSESRLLVLEASVGISFDTDCHDNESGSLIVDDMRVFIAYGGINALTLRRGDMTSIGDREETIGTLIVEPITVQCQLQKILAKEDSCPRRMIKVDVKKGGQVRISYSDIKFLVSIIRQFQQHRSMAALQRIDTESLSVLAERGKVLKEVLEETNVFSKRFHLDFQLVSENRFGVLIVDDITGFDIPLFEIIGTDVVSQALIRQQQHMTVSAFLHFNIGANYYNFRIAEWEPVIEHTAVPIKTLVEMLPVSYKNARQRRIDTEHKFAVDILAGMIDFNLSHSMAQTTLKTYHLWMEGLHADRRDTVSQRFEPYSITNETGMPAYFYRQDDIDDDDGSVSGRQFEMSNVRRTELKQGCTIRFSFADEDNPRKHFIYIVVGSSTPKKLLISRVRKWYFDMDQDSANSIDRMSEGPISKYIHRDVRKMFCIESQLIEGCKCITIHSGVKLRNASAVPWEIGCFVSAAVPTPASETTRQITAKSLCVLESDESFYVPCQYVYSSVLALRPAGEQFLTQYRWCSPRLGHSFTNLSKEFGKRLLGCRHTEDSSNRFFCVLNSAQQHTRTMNFVVDVIIDIMPPLSIENLLGYDLEFMLFRQSSYSKGFTGIFNDTLKSGEKRSIYTISLKDNLWMSAKMPGWQNRHFSRIYGNQIGAELDMQMTNIDEEGRRLPIRIDYCTSGQAFHEVIVFCSYWVIDMTDKSINVMVQGAEAPGRIHDSDMHTLVDSSFSAPHGTLHQTPQNVLDIQSLDMEQESHAIAHWQQPQSQSLQHQQQSRLHDALKMTKSPLMFDYDNPNLVFSNKVSLSIGSRFTSKNFSIDNAGTSNVIEMSDANRRFWLGLFVEPGPGRYKRTKFVYISPQFVIVNNTDHVLYCKQSDHSIVQQIAAGNVCQYYWPGNSTDPMLCVRIEGSIWSSPFRPNIIGEIPLVLEKEKDEDIEFQEVEDASKTAKEYAFIVVQVQQEKGVVFVVIDHVTFPPFYLHNKTTDVNLQFRQRGSNKWLDLPPLTRIPFSWHDLYGEHRLDVMVENSPQHCHIIEANVVSSERKFVTTTPGRHMYSKVTAHAMTRTVHFTNTRMRGSNAAPSHRQRHFLQVTTKIIGIGVSMIDHMPRELMYITLQGLDCDFSMTHENQFFEFKLKRLQVDNQLPSALYPVALSNAVKLEGRDFLHISCVRHYHEKSYHYFPYFSMLVQEADMMLDIGFVNGITNFIVTLVKVGSSKSNAGDGSRRHVDQSPADTRILSVLQRGIEIPHFTNASEQKRVYFESLVLHPIKWNFSFIFNNPSIAAAGGSNGMDAGDENSSNKDSLLFTIIQTIGTHLNANIDEVPIKLNALILQHPFMPVSALLESIGQHYAKRSMQEMYKLIGSFDMIGNPIGLVNDFDTAMFDLFYEPMEAITRNPRDFAKGLARGSLSFLKHSIHGTFNTASKVTDTVGTGLSYLSLDNSYIHVRQHNRIHRRPRHAGEGMLYGLRALGEGVIEGASGIITKPIQGASSGGVLGFFSGIGKGLVGAPIKPVSGVFEAVSQAAEGIRKTTKYFDSEEKRRARLPRAIGVDDTLRPFTAEHAIGQMYLFEVLEQERRQQRQQEQQQQQRNMVDRWQNENQQHLEKYVFHTVVAGDCVVLLSTARLFDIRAVSSAGISVEWQQPLLDFVSVKRIKKDQTSGEVLLKVSAACQQRQRESSWFGRVSIAERRITSDMREDQESLDRLYEVLYSMINQRDQERILDDSIR